MSPSYGGKFIKLDDMLALALGMGWTVSPTYLVTLFEKKYRVSERVASRMYGEITNYAHQIQARVQSHPSGMDVLFRWKLAPEYEGIFDFHAYPQLAEIPDRPPDEYGPEADEDPPVTPADHLALQRKPLH